ncbi:hypothetical protein [Collinsella tanakaei]|uniref:hypothetical protein n=1 Tax=Collinsella tanakaei TaxID=626935 RepID=UPI003AB914D2
MVEQDRAQMSRGAEKTGMTTAANEPMRRDAAPSPNAFRTEEARGGRRHMGVATSDPQYLPLTPQEQARERQRSQNAGQQPDAHNAAPRPAHPMQTIQPGTHRSLQHSARYLSTPKPGKTIFKSRYEKQHRHAKAVLLAVLLIAAILGLVWYFFPR